MSHNATKAPPNAFVVESPVTKLVDGEQKRIGTARVWVATESRASQLAAEHPERSWRPMTDEEKAKDLERHEQARSNAAE